jgi:hypothetical protein
MIAEGDAMPVQNTIESRPARRRLTRQGRPLSHIARRSDDDDAHEIQAPPEPTPRVMPRIATAVRGAEGEIRHSRCNRDLTFIGIRGGIEIDFYCLTCREHVTLTESALSRLPLAEGVTR